MPHRHREKGISQAHYQRLLSMMLRSVRRGVSREQLLNGLLDALQQRRVARYVVLITGYRDPEDKERLAEVSIERIVGCEGKEQEGRCRNLERAFSRRWQKSVLLHNTLLWEEEQDFLLTSRAADVDFYRGEFRELHGSAPVWLCAVPLPPQRIVLPYRALFVIYDNVGTEEQPMPPPGAEQEWSLLQQLPQVYAVLEHQLRTMAEQVARQRRELIMELAPRFINHEFGTSLGIMRDALMRMRPILLRLHNRLGDDTDLNDLVEELLRLDGQIKRSSRLTEAFNNIEKRNPGQPVPLRTLVEEACDLLAPLMRRANITVHLDDVADTMTHTDSALIQHVILNVLMNALEAIRDDDARPDDDDGVPQRRNIWIRATVERGRADVRISNDGPPIPPHLSLSVFEKGVTTRSHGTGHGQGLYISRLVAQYLGGEFGYCPADGNPMPGNVCFRLTFLLGLQEALKLEAAAAN